MSPIKIRTKSKTINVDTPQPIYFWVPCGHCAECLQLKSNEYYFRAYYEILGVLNNGGMALFDTLTYRPEDAPHFNDMIPSVIADDFKFVDGDNRMCFNRYHISKFKKDLRRQLTYYGYDSSKLRVFVSPEYAKDARYTCRPHYHVIVTFSDMSISPDELSRFIDKCWPYGITDGVVNKEGVKRGDSRTYDGSRRYVLSKRLLTYDGINVSQVRNLCSYLSKYVLKDLSYKSDMKRYRAILESALISNGYFDFVYTTDGDTVTVVDEEGRTYLRRFFSDVDMTPKIPQGFGLYGVDVVGMESIMDGTMYMYDDKVRTDYPVFNYYKNHLFKERVRDEIFGEDYYTWSEKGNEYRYANIMKNLDKQSRRYDELFTNLEVYGYSIDEAARMRKKIRLLLGSSSFKDLCVYEKFQRGRYIPKKGLDIDYYVLNSLRDYRSCSGVRLTRDAFFSDVKLNESLYFVPRYEAVLDLFKSIIYKRGRDIQADYEKREELRLRRKELGLYYKNN